jgi:hypothetical protein
VTEQPEPEDTCRPVEVDGETIRVRGFGEMRERDRAFAAEIVRAAKRKFDAEPLADRLRQEIAGVLRDAPGRWNIRARTDAVMAALDRFLDIGEAEAWCKTCRRVWDGPSHRCESNAEQRVAALYEQWVKAGPPPLGTLINRWWDARLVELHHAILPPTDQSKEQ